MRISILRTHLFRINLHCVPEDNFNPVYSLGILTAEITHMNELNVECSSNSFFSTFSVFSNIQKYVGLSLFFGLSGRLTEALVVPACRI